MASPSVSCADSFAAAPCSRPPLLPMSTVLETIAMRAEAEAYAVQIQQALALLRRFL